MVLEKWQSTNTAEQLRGLWAEVNKWKSYFKLQYIFSHYQLTKWLITLFLKNISHLAWLSWISLHRRISCSVRLQAPCQRSSRAPPTGLTVAANSGSVCSTFSWSRISPRAALLSSSWTNVRCSKRRGTNQCLCQNRLKPVRTSCCVRCLLTRQFHTNFKIEHYGRGHKKDGG